MFNVSVLIGSNRSRLIRSLPFVIRTASSSVAAEAGFKGGGGEKKKKKAPLPRVSAVFFSGFSKVTSCRFWFASHCPA